ncbi:MAG: hypothetical protein GX066_01765 [Clostridiaceae bacterium]|nr:hypothetical protein [Clostridiaceae bacterium]
MIKIFLLIVSGFICTQFIQKQVIHILKESGRIRQNYKGERIPDSMGIALVFSMGVAIGFDTLFGWIENRQVFTVFFPSAFMGFAGLVDDVLGNSYSKGFKGHINSLLKGKLTTGGVKAIAGFITSFFVSLQISSNPYYIVIDTFLISLTSNLINLLDTRPGRAVKGYMIFLFLPMFSGRLTGIHYISLGVLAAYLPLDLKAEGMLGDTGANFIGMMLGIGLAISVQDFVLKLIIFIIVMFLNVASERYSFSRIIERNPVLRFIDNLGRL